MSIRTVEFAGGTGEQFEAFVNSQPSDTEIIITGDIRISFNINLARECIKIRRIAPCAHHWVAPRVFFTQTPASITIKANNIEWENIPFVASEPGDYAGIMFQVGKINCPTWTSCDWDSGRGTCLKFDGTLSPLINKPSVTLGYNGSQEGTFIHCTGTWPSSPPDRTSFLSIRGAGSARSICFGRYVFYMERAEGFHIDSVHAWGSKFGVYMTPNETYTIVNMKFQNCRFETTDDAVVLDKPGFFSPLMQAGFYFINCHIDTPKHPYIFQHPIENIMIMNGWAKSSGGYPWYHAELGLTNSSLNHVLPDCP